MRPARHGRQPSHTAALPIFKFHTGKPLDYLLIYPGVSIAMHAFPSRGDANVIWNSVRQPGTPLWVKIVGGVGVATGLPNLLIALMA